MKSLLLLFFIAIASLQIGCSNKSEETQVVSTEVYKEVIKDTSLALVDVRTKKEFEEGSLPGAVNIDFLDEANFYNAFEKYDREEPIYLFCRSGNRSLKAAQKLKDMGFKEIYDMEGGYLQWTKEKP